MLEPITITINGIPRSGSTLVQQIITACCAEVAPSINIQRTHPAYPLPEYGHCFITTRHPYDVAASRYRVRLSRTPTADGWLGLEAEMHEMAKHYHALGSLFYLPHTLLRYEDFYDDTSLIFTALEDHLGGIFSLAMMNRIDAMFSFENNKARADKLATFNDVDDAGIHGDHLATPCPGAWRTSLPKELHQQMLDFCQPIAEYHHYE